ncbi:unnamed protein product [Rotaria sp. Silwood2]|nr:unnamed protein product [Rotaria sp. Silwood2]CAF2963971.1 unnamed protein product [Rotaria sp. Silwood2]CAF4102666.1 unnamed protein product [Rotaria sp. Silwood2]CAF4185880.1 unnamed protein product [Rotaria sp. Silwood2]
MMSAHFTLPKNYSTSDNHMNSAKQYVPETENPYENLGHQVKIDLKWNAHAQNVDDQWVIRTTMYSGQDKFELKLR